MFCVARHGKVLSRRIRGGAGCQTRRAYVLGSCTGGQAAQWHPAQCIVVVPTTAEQVGGLGGQRINFVDSHQNFAGLPAPPPNKSMLYTGLYHDITIRIKDQFAEPLASVYDGKDKVFEKLTDVSENGQHLPDSPKVMINAPTGQLESGSIVDRIAELRAVEQPKLTAQETADLKQFKYTFTDGQPPQTFDDAWAHTVAAEGLAGLWAKTHTQEIWVHGHDITPKWRRQLRLDIEKDPPAAEVQRMIVQEQE